MGKRFWIALDCIRKNAEIMMLRFNHSGGRHTLTVQLGSGVKRKVKLTLVCLTDMACLTLGGRLDNLLT